MVHHITIEQISVGYWSTLLRESPQKLDFNEQGLEVHKCWIHFRVDLHLTPSLQPYLSESNLNTKNIHFGLQFPFKEITIIAYCHFQHLKNRWLSLVAETKPTKNFCSVTRAGRKSDLH